MLLAIGLTVLAGSAAAKDQQVLADKVVRLHVVANSDTAEDQAVKLQVRDAVAQYTEQVLRSCSNREEAQRRLCDLLPELNRLVEDTVRQQGYTYDTSVVLGQAAFPTKTYDGFALPAGEYMALRVLLGEAEGQNWWCVVFPPLCAAAAGEVSVAAAGAGLSEEEIHLITEDSAGYVIKFKTIELWQKLRLAMKET